MVDLDAMIDLFQCPQTGQPVEGADEATIEAINRSIGAGELRDFAGNEVRRTIDGALRPRGAEFVYPIRDGIPNFLPGHRLPA